MMRIFMYLIRSTDAPFYLVIIEKRIPIAEKAKSADAIIITAVMSLVGDEIIYESIALVISDIVITMEENKSDDE